MFKFGALLVETWRQSTKQNRQLFTIAFKSWKKLLA